MQERHNQHHAKVHNCFTQLQSMDVVTKSKMFKFYRNVSRAFTELDKEFVECRRTRRITPKYTELELPFNESVTLFEQYSIIAVLTYS